MSAFLADGAIFQPAAIPAWPLFRPGLRLKHLLISLTSVVLLILCTGCAVVTVASTAVSVAGTAVSVGVTAGSVAVGAATTVAKGAVAVGGAVVGDDE